MVAKEEKEEDVVFSRIRQNELFWVERYEFLKREGFQLRPRYQPGFKAPLDSGEPSLALTIPDVIDATRIRNGKKVCLKYMSPAETLQLRKISLGHKEEPGNHAVPILDFISEGNEGYQIAVLPYLREFDDPKFLTVGEVVDAMNQFLEGIDFFHSKNLAHRDACSGNMMMDASQLIPNGWHMVRPWTEDGEKPITSVPRSSVAVKYYFIDFGLSVTVNAAEPVAKGVVGQDRTVPEFQNSDGDVEYNPFKLDIYQLGNAFQTSLLERYEGLDFLRPLTTSMTQLEPEKRPTASEARETFRSLTEGVDLTKPITSKPESPIRADDPPVQISTDSKGEKGEKSKRVDALKTWVSSLWSRFKRAFRP